MFQLQVIYLGNWITCGLIILCIVQVSAHYKCLSCSYIFAGNDGSAGYECVSTPLNFTLTTELSCHEPSQCIIDAVYEEGFTRLLSMDRGCRKPTKSNGCLNTSTRPSCTYTCDENLCNDDHGDLKHNMYNQTNGSPTLSVHFALFLLVSCFMYNTLA